MWRFIAAVAVVVVVVVAVVVVAVTGDIGGGGVWVGGVLGGVGIRGSLYTVKKRESRAVFSKRGRHVDGL